MYAYDPFDYADLLDWAFSVMSAAQGASIGQFDWVGSRPRFSPMQSMRFYSVPW
jgi:hypothetical protein